MEASNILEDLTKVVIDVLDHDDIVLKRETVADDVEDWDSLNHIQIVVGVEKHFKIKFSSAEILSWKNVGQMCDAIQRVLEARKA